MHPGIKRRARTIGGGVLVAVVCVTSAAAQTTITSAASPNPQPAVWQGPAINAQSAPAAATADPSHALANELRVALQPAPPIPPQTIQLSPAGELVPATQPLLDDSSPVEELMPPVVENGYVEGCERRGVKPYGGGHPDDWSWGCGGSPYRTGPGMCDNYKVGPRWHWTFDGLVMSRDATDLQALIDQMNDPANFVQGGVGADTPPQLENFGYGSGGRITITSEVPRYVGYQIQAAYEGIIDWDAAIVFPKIPDAVIDPVSMAPILSSSVQRSLHYTSDYNSGEINWVTSYDDDWHPFFGVRYIKVDERLTDFLDQEAPPPLPGNPPALPNPVITADQKNLIGIDNNLMGFQVGMLHEAWCVNRRFTIEGFVNAGVYYNNINYYNKMGTYTTQVGQDIPSTTTVNEGGTSFSNSVNNDASDLSEISYVTEASLSGVCRLNKCWALRGGYQILWIDQVHLADAAFLGNPEQSDSLLFHGWHAGIECRR